MSSVILFILQWMAPSYELGQNGQMDKTDKWTKRTFFLSFFRISALGHVCSLGLDQPVTDLGILFLNPKIDMRGPCGPRTTSNGCSTLTNRCPAKIFCAILNKTEHHKIATCLFACAISFPYRTPLSAILGRVRADPGQL